nr:hypothetical protein [Tanacetum cinerariifolium]
MSKVEDLEQKGHIDSVYQLCWDPKHSDLIGKDNRDSMNIEPLEKLSLEATLCSKGGTSERHFTEDSRYREEDKAVNEEMDDSLKRAATTASSLKAEQESGNINKIQSKATLNEPSSIGTSSGSGPRCQETIRDTIAQSRSENVSKFSNDSLLVEVNTPQIDKDSLKLKELMKLCTNLQNIILDLENTKTTQALEIDSLKRRVKKLEKKQRLITYKLKRLYKVGLITRVDSSDKVSLGEDASKLERIIDDIDIDEGITLVDNTTENQGRFNDQEHGRSIMVNTFVDYMTKLVVESLKEVKSEVIEVSSKRDGKELEQENAKKQKMEDDKESTELKQCLKIILEDGDDVTINSTPLSSNKMLKIFDREDLKVLWRLIKTRFEKIKPVNYMDNLLMHNLKTMFEHHVEDNTWKNQQGRIVGIKRLLDDLKITAVKVCVTAAKQNLVLFSNLNEKYAK